MAHSHPPADGRQRPGGLGTAGTGQAGTRIAVMGHIDDVTAAAVLSLAGAAARVDGPAPLSEQARLHLRHGGGPSAHSLLLWQATELAGYAHLDAPGPDGGRSGELVVHPAHRRRGLGRLLARAVAAQAGPRAARIWAHGDLPAAARLAEVAGFRRVRALWTMRRPLAGPAPEAHLPSGVTVRTFVPGADEQRWLAVNARAFAGHPEQGTWTEEDLRRREGEPWFDPEGFFLAERDGRLAGFHWTKIHPPGPGGTGVGEVYVVGVDPGEQGTGLGRALTLTGLAHLRRRGVREVMLYVDEDNSGAARLYASLGFTHDGTDVMYEHRAGEAV